MPVVKSGDIQNLDSSVDNVQNMLTVLKSEIVENQKNKAKFKYHEINYGFKYLEKMKIPMSLYLVDIFDVISAILSSSCLKNYIDRDYTNSTSVYRSFFDGGFFQDHAKKNSHQKKKIFLSLYGDEINVCCVIGDFFYHKILIIFRSIQKKSQNIEYLLPDTQFSSAYAVID